MLKSFVCMAEDLDKLKEKMTGLAEEIARTYRIKLDYSHESILHVEDILGKHYDDYVRTGSDSGLTGIAFAFGAYLVKVIEKNVGPVRWERDHPEMGEDTFPLYLPDDEVVFPFGWCMKRILDGPGDNVWTKYQFFVLKQDPPAGWKKGFLRRIFGR